MLDIVSVGGATLDVFVRTDLSKIVTTHDLMTSQQMLAFDYPSKVNVDDVRFATGGGATNTAVAFSRLGLRAACIATVGCDTAGDEILAELAAEGVDASLMLRSPEAKTGYSVVLNSFEGDRTVLTYRGANSTMEPSRIPWWTIRAARWLYVSSLTGSSGDLLEDLALWARSSCVSLVLNPGATQIRMGIRNLARILPLIDVLILNKEEASLLTGVQWTRRVAVDPLCNLCEACVDACPVGLFRIADGRLYVGDQHRCIRCGECLSICPTRAIQMEPWASNLDPVFLSLRDLGAQLVVITDGGNGAQAFDGVTRYIVPPCDVSVVDTLGAGDAYGAGLVAALYNGLGLERAMLWAAANAGSVVQRTGAKEGLLRADEVEDFIATRHPGLGTIRKGPITEPERHGDALASWHEPAPVVPVLDEIQAGARFEQTRLYT